MPSIHIMQDQLGRSVFTVTVVVALVLGSLGIAAVRRRGGVRTAATLSALGITIVVAGVLSLTLLGEASPGASQRRLILDPIAGAWGWDSIAWRPVYDNIAMFLPVGVFATALWWRRSPGLVWLVCVGFSIAIEAFQFLVPTGRVANAADVLANGLGALAGVLLATLAGVRTPPRPAPATRRSLSASRSPER